MLWNSWCCRLLGTPGADMRPGVRSLFTWLEYFVFSIIFSLSLKSWWLSLKKRKRMLNCSVRVFHLSWSLLWEGETTLFFLNSKTSMPCMCCNKMVTQSFPRQMKEKTKIKYPEKSPALWIVLFLVFQTCHSSLKPKIKNKKILPRLNETTWLRISVPPHLSVYLGQS